MPPAQHSPVHPQVVIAGGGLAGIAAATVLARSGLHPILLEARQSLGGRATSYVDAESGEVIDNCQHVSMGCCTSLRFLCELLEIDSPFQTEEALTFIAPNGSLTRFCAGPLPAPLHLTGSFLKLPWLSLKEKVLFARAVGRLAKTPRIELAGKNFYEWLVAEHQTEQLIRNLWEVVLVSALSEPLERIDAAYAQKVFVDGFLNHRDGWQVELPRLTLEELYSVRTMDSLRKLGAEVRTQARVVSLTMNGDQVGPLKLQDGSEVSGHDYILAIPHHQLINILPSAQTGLDRFRQLREQISQLESSPITSVHLWYDRPIMDLPHAVLIDRLGQWVFSRGERNGPNGPRFLYQVVISASRPLQGIPQEEIIQRIHKELSSIWSDARDARLLHSRMITERRAVFSAVPGVDAVRPGQETEVSNLFLAGDWTQTGWPATMEGAVRSGMMAANQILRKYDLPEVALPEGLQRSWLSRLLWGHPPEETSSGTNTPKTRDRI